MVLLVVDDLFFSIKIKTAAQHLGTEVFFERTGAHTLDTIKDKKPRLVVFDLDAAKLRPIETVAAMKSDPELRAVPTLGFVSHVHADTMRLGPGQRRNHLGLARRVDEPACGTTHTHRRERR